MCVCVYMCVLIHRYVYVCIECMCIVKNMCVCCVFVCLTMYDLFGKINETRKLYDELCVLKCEKVDSYSFLCDLNLS